MLNKKNQFLAIKAHRTPAALHRKAAVVHQ
jgi:hypothetical protein